MSLKYIIMEVLKMKIRTRKEYLEDMLKDLEEQKSKLKKRLLKQYREKNKYTDPFYMGYLEGIRKVEKYLKKEIEINKVNGNRKERDYLEGLQSGLEFGFKTLNKLYEL